ncbi:hypothetical protein GQ42DRAFT_93542, partial [Ramicandelaber brevisporus]
GAAVVRLDVRVELLEERLERSGAVPVHVHAEIRRRGVVLQNAAQLPGCEIGAGRVRVDAQPTEHRKRADDHLQRLVVKRRHAVETQVVQAGNRQPPIELRHLASGGDGTAVAAAAVGLHLVGRQMVVLRGAVYLQLGERGGAAPDVLGHIRSDGNLQRQPQLSARSRRAGQEMRAEAGDVVRGIRPVLELKHACPAADRLCNLLEDMLVLVRADVKRISNLQLDAPQHAAARNGRLEEREENVAAGVYPPKTERCKRRCSQLAHDAGQLANAGGGCNVEIQNLQVDAGAQSRSEQLDGARACVRLAVITADGGEPAAKRVCSKRSHEGSQRRGAAVDNASRELPKVDSAAEFRDKGRILVVLRAVGVEKCQVLRRQAQRAVRCAAAGRVESAAGRQGAQQEEVALEDELQQLIRQVCKAGRHVSRVVGDGRWWLEQNGAGGGRGGAGE